MAGVAQSRQRERESEPTAFGRFLAGAGLPLLRLNSLLLSAMRYETKLF